uniref:hypothetical protein n=1 Tax=Escherichia coli TaxID=562 RepID=UPI001F4AC690
HLQVGAAAVSRDGPNLQVVEGGSPRNYSFGNVVWSVFGATDTDGQPGAEIIGRTSTGIYVISNASSRRNTASAPAPGHSMAA